MKPTTNSHNLFLEPHLENPQCTSCWGALIAGITFQSSLEPPLGYITNYQISQFSLGTSPGVFESFGTVDVRCSLHWCWVFKRINYQPMKWNNQTLSYYFEIKVKDNLSTTVTIRFNHENFKIYIVVRSESNMVHLWLS
jgi:hypothetical protein